MSNFYFGYCFFAILCAAKEILIKKSKSKLLWPKIWCIILLSYASKPVVGLKSTVWIFLSVNKRSHVDIQCYFSLKHVCILKTCRIDFLLHAKLIQLLSCINYIVCIRVCFFFFAAFANSLLCFNTKSQCQPHWLFCYYCCTLIKWNAIKFQTIWL